MTLELIRTLLAQSYNTK